MRSLPLGPGVSRLVQFVEAWPTARRFHDADARLDVLRRFATLDDADEAVLMHTPTGDLDALWAGAFLARYGPADEIADAALPVVAPGDYEAASIALRDRDKRLTQARRAERTLRARGWTFNARTGRVEDAGNVPEGGRPVKGNRRKLLFTKMVEVAYREMAPRYRERTGDNASNPQELQAAIADTLGLFFPPDLLTLDRIRAAIDNYVRRRKPAS
jgi:hypothetical protein